MATLVLGAVGTLLGRPVDGALGALVGRRIDGAVAGDALRIYIPAYIYKGHGGQMPDPLFAAPREGMRVFDKAAGQTVLYAAGWVRAAPPAPPAGGATVDSEARAAIADLIEALRISGTFPAAG